MKGTVIYHAPVGDLQVDWEDGAITALKRAGADVKEAGAPNELTEQVFRQLDEYFAGTRRRFDFPHRLHGTPFQEKVWAALRDIPYARRAATRTLRKPSATRRRSARWAWPTMRTRYASPCPATASSARAALSSATAAGWT